MTSIDTSLYTTLNTYSSLSGLTDSDSTSTSEETTATSVTTTDTVTLSSEVSIAQAREYYGLAATGKLTLSDFENASATQEETVSTILAAAMESLGIDENQEVSLSLDDDGNIEIAESFTGKDELEEYLNQNETFVQAFSGLSANNEVLDYASSLTSMSVSLADYIDSETSDSDLLALASKYSLIKSANSISDLWQLSHSETPYTYTYNAAE